MGTNYKHFNERVGLRVKKVNEEVLPQYFRGVVLEAARRLILKTPVLTGRARGGWQVSINSPGVGEQIKSKTGSRAISLAASRAQKLTLADTAYIVNGVAYIRHLERGRSKQAPRGMLRVTLVEMRKVLK